MLISQPQDKLNEKIRGFAASAIESRQVASRLRDLLPVRFFDIKRRHFSVLKSAARAERQALTDKGYEAHINELVEVSFNARYARVQYETHLMLTQARQSLRRHAKR